MFSCIRVLAFTLSISIFFSSPTSRAGIAGIADPALRAFYISYLLYKLGRVFTLATIQTMLQNVRNQDGRYLFLLGEDEEIANIMDLMVDDEGTDAGVVSHYLHQSQGPFTVIIVVNGHDMTPLQVSSQQYHAMRALVPALAHLMPIPFYNPDTDSSTVLVNIPRTILHTLVSIVNPVVPEHSSETASEWTYEDEIVVLLGDAITGHVNNHSIISREGILLTLSFLLEVQQLSTSMLLFRSNIGEERYWPSLQHLLEDYRRLILITDPNTPAFERRRLLEMLIKQYKEDHSDDPFANPLTNYYCNQWAAIRYLMHEINTLVEQSSESLDETRQSLATRRKTGEQVSDNELKALEAKEREMALLDRVLKFRYQIRKIEEERIGLFSIFAGIIHETMSQVELSKIDAHSVQSGFESIKEECKFHNTKCLLKEQKIRDEEQNASGEKDKKEPKTPRKFAVPKVKITRKHSKKKLEKSGAPSSVITESSDECTTSSSTTASSHAEGAMSHSPSTSSPFLSIASSSGSSPPQSSQSPSPRSGTRHLVRKSLEDLNPLKRSVINHNGANKGDKDKDKDPEKK